MATATTTHGRTYTPEYRTWSAMKQRCENPKHKSFKHYGGRGITVCERWRTFENFLADMGLRPEDKIGIDRVDNDGNYEPSNCRWATHLEQGRNRRKASPSMTTDANDKIKPPHIVHQAADRIGGLSELARRIGIKHPAFYSWVQVPAERVLAIERATGVSRHDLRPDLYPREE